MEMTLILGSYITALCVGLLTAYQIIQIKKLREESVLKTDRVYRELSLVLKDAAKDGEGVFSVKKLDENEYFMRLDPDKLFRRGQKI